MWRRILKIRWLHRLGFFYIDGRSSRDNINDISSVYADIKWLLIIKEKDPWAFLLQYHNIKSNTEHICHSFGSLLFHLGIFNLQGYYRYSGMVRMKLQMNNAARPEENNVIHMKLGYHRLRSLVLEGPVHTSKTAWAKSLGTHNYICGHLDFNLITFWNDVLYNVINDVAPHYLRLNHWK